MTAWGMPPTPHERHPRAHCANSGRGNFHNKEPDGIDDLTHTEMYTKIACDLLKW